MDLIGSKVKHITLGSGIVTAQDDRFISVAFDARISKFAYPVSEIFAKVLQAEDPDIQTAVLQEIADSKAIQEAQKRDADKARTSAEELCSSMTAMKKSLEPSKGMTAVRRGRIPGQRMTFFVFQGNTYTRESKGGYIWAPIFNKSGNTCHHWDRLLDIRQKDVIFHGFDGYVHAISTATSECFECKQPDELRAENLWDQEGRRVDCDYLVLKSPIKTSAFRDDIRRLSNAKYSPFDKDGNGNMGYLYELNRELARIFLEASVKNNPYLGKVDFIRDLLPEDSDDY